MKKEYLPGQFHILVFIMMRKIKQKKLQQTDPHCNNKKKKQHQIRIKFKIYNVPLDMYAHLLAECSNSKFICFGLKHIWFSRAKTK